MPLTRQQVFERVLQCLCLSKVFGPLSLTPHLCGWGENLKIIQNLFEFLLHRLCLPEDEHALSLTQSTHFSWYGFETS